MFVLFFIILTFYLYNNNDDVANIIAHDGLYGLFWYFLSNIPYVLILISIFVLNPQVGFGRNLLGGFMMVYAMDIVSFPRLSVAGMTTDIGLLSSSDALVMNHILKLGINYSTAYTFYYLVLPILLILGSLSILGIHNFFKQLTGGQK